MDPSLHCKSCLDRRRARFRRLWEKKLLLDLRNFPGFVHLNQLGLVYVWAGVRSLLHVPLSAGINTGFLWCADEQEAGLQTSTGVQL